MNVFVVIVHTPDSCRVLGVARTRERAERIADALYPKTWADEQETIIEEVPVE